MIAFSCSTPIHVMRAVQFHTCIMQFRELADIYINDCFLGAESVAKRLVETNLFENVILLNNNDLERKSLAHYIYGLGKGNKIFKQNKYRRILSFSINSDQSNILYNINRKVKNFEFYILEDAPMLYDIPIYADYGKHSIKRLLGMKRACFNADYWWFSEPSMMQIPELYGDVKKGKMPKIPLDNKELVNILNYIFDYKDDVSLDSADVLIMDESYYQDGVMIGNEDIRLFRVLKDNYPSLKFIVKMHPRTVDNRYDGFLCMENQHIPWELFVLNRVVEGKKPITQVSIACSTMISDKFLFDVENPKIFLAPLFCDRLWEIDGEIRRNRVSKELISRINTIQSSYRNKNTIKMVYSECDLDKCLG